MSSSSANRGLGTLSKSNENIQSQRKAESAPDAGKSNRGFVIFFPN